MTERQLPQKAVENLVEDLASKANVDLSNLNATGQAKFDAKANIDLNNLSTAGQAIINGKADINLSNLNNTGNAAASNLNSKGIRTVIETYVNGTTWYRVWSDGWIEQGKSGITVVLGGTAVTFAKAFKDTNYTVIASSSKTGGAQASSTVTVFNKSTTGSTVSGSEVGLVVAFYACGY